VVGDGAGQAIFGQVTPWVAYTPTFTAFGTPAGVTARSRRVGGNLEVALEFTCGTTTSSTAVISIGFDGGNSNVAVASWVSLRKLIGAWASSEAGANIGNPSVLGLGGDTFVAVGLKASGRSALTPVAGNVVGASGDRISMHFSVPIEGWS
jgi:hypothetical protein